MNISFKTKLHSLFILLMIVFIIVSTVISYLVSERLIIDNIKISNESELLLSVQTMQNLKQKSKEQFRLFVDDYKPTINEWTKEVSNDISFKNHNQEIISDILAFLYTNKEFSGMYLVQNHQLVGTSLQTQLITNTDDISNASDPSSTRQQFMDVLIQNGQFTPETLKDEYMLVTQTEEGTVLIAVLDLQNLGVLNNINLLLINSKEQVVFDVASHQPSIINLIKPHQEVEGTIHTERLEQQIVSSYTSDNQERYVLIQDISQLSERFKHITWIVGAIGFLLVIVFTTVSDKVSTHILNPIYDFINKLRQNKGYENRQLMEDYIASYEGRSTVAKNIFKYYFLLFIPVSIVIMLSYLYFDQIIETNSKQDLHNVFNKTKDGIENNLRSYSSYIRYLSLDREFQNLMLIAGRDQGHSFNAAFSDILVRKGILNKDISTVSVYNSKNQLLYSNVSHPIEHRSQETAATGVDKYSQEFDIVKNELDAMQPVVMMRKSILYLNKPTDETKKFDYMGYIELGIQNMFTYTNLFKLPENDYSVNLQDNRGQLFSLTTPRENTSKKTKVINFPLVDDKLHLEFWASEYWDKQKFVFILLYAIELVCMLIIITLASSLLGKRMTAPILRAIQVMEVYPQHSNVRLHSAEREFEFVVLAKSFNQMLTQLEELNDELRVKELENVVLDRRINKLTRQALQAQINPHFLQNIFTSIMMLLKTGKSDKAANMLVDTAQFLKSGLYGTSDLVRIQDELDHVTAYMKLQTIRHENQLKLEIEVDEKYERIPMPKFILQPIVENAIHHGMERDKLLTIRIYCYTKDPSTIVIEVSDDGKGMSVDRFNEMNEQLEKRSQSAHYGLSNVHERIYLEFGTSYGLSIERSLHRGTTISIRLPNILEGN